MDAKIKWVRDLGSPTEPCNQQYDGCPLAVAADDIARAKAELGKGLSDVTFNVIRQNSKEGRARYILGSIA